MTGVLVRGGIGGTAVGLIEHEAAGIVTGLQDVEAEIPRFQDRGLVIDPRRRNEIINMPGSTTDMRNPTSLGY